MGQEPEFQFVVGFCHCSEEFLSGYSGFPLSSRTNSSKFEFDLDTVVEEPHCGFATANSHLFIQYLFIYLIFYFITYLFIYLFIYNSYKKASIILEMGKVTLCYSIYLFIYLFIYNSYKKASIILEMGKVTLCDLD